MACLLLVVLDEHLVELVLALGDGPAAVGDLARGPLTAAHGRLDALVAVDLALILDGDALQVKYT